MAEKKLFSRIQNLSTSDTHLQNEMGYKFVVPAKGEVTVEGDPQYFKKYIVAGLRGLVVKEATAQKRPIMEQRQRRIIRDDPELCLITNHTKKRKLVTLGTGVSQWFEPGQEQTLMAVAEKVKKIQGMSVKPTKPVKKAPPPNITGMGPPPPVVVVEPIRRLEEKSVLRSDAVAPGAAEARKRDLDGLKGRLVPTGAELRPETKTVSEADDQTIKLEVTEKDIEEAAARVVEQQLAEQVPEPPPVERVKPQAEDKGMQPKWAQLHLPPTEEEFRAVADETFKTMRDLRGLGYRLNVKALRREELTDKIAEAVYRSEE